MMAIVLLAIGFAANACAQFQAPMRPLLETYCQRCHGTTVQTAGINFTAASPSNRLLLKKMLRVLQDREMPAAAPLPTAEEREKMIAWVAEELKRNVDAVPKSAGHVTLPRLNRIEYNNTIRDLTGLDLRPADSFPVDPPGESGFNNDRYGLFLSPLLIEKYMDAAGFIAGELIAARANTKPFALKLEVEDMRITEMQTPKKPYGYDVGAPQNTIYEYVKFPRSGTYTFHVRAWGRQGTAQSRVGVSLRVDGELAGQSIVFAKADAPAVYTFRAPVKRGSRRVSVHYFSTSFGGQTRDVLSLDWIEIADVPELRAREDGSAVFIAAPGPKLPEEKAARMILDRFAARAYRRPATGSEIDSLLAAFKTARRGGQGFDESVGAGLKAVLVSPLFLFRVEGSDKLTDFDLASRMSYMLWMSTPDEELLQLAKANRLRDAQTIARQVKRMISDPKSSSFVEHFFGQWLGYSELSRGGPDRKTFPEFSPALRDAMIDESKFFFESLLRENSSLLRLLDADYTYLNQDLADHYGIGGVKGNQMMRVPLSDRNRGGVLGMGSVLTATSLPVRTSPVVRGKWLLEVLLGEKLPLPPANAGDLPETNKETAKLTVRQRFELHRASPQCASCHNRIDPLGYGLENFDAIGRWREKENGQPVDSLGVLSSGQQFRGPAELKKILLARKDAFARTISGKMLSFALGRDLKDFDEPAVEQIAKAAIAGDWRPSALLEAVIKSYPFQNKQKSSQEGTE